MSDTLDSASELAILRRELMATASDLRAGKPIDAVASQIDYTLNLMSWLRRKDETKQAALAAVEAIRPKYSRPHITKREGQWLTEQGLHDRYRSVPGSFDQACVAARAWCQGT